MVKKKVPPFLISPQEVEILTMGKLLETKYHKYERKKGKNLRRRTSDILRIGEKHRRQNISDFIPLAEKSRLVDDPDIFDQEEQEEEEERDSEDENLRLDRGFYNENDSKNSSKLMDNSNTTNEGSTKEGRLTRGKSAKQFIASYKFDGKRYYFHPRRKYLQKESKRSTWRLPRRENRRPLNNLRVGDWGDLVIDDNTKRELEARRRQGLRSTKDGGEDHIKASDDVNYYDHRKGIRTFTRILYDVRGKYSKEICDGVVGETLDVIHDLHDQAKRKFYADEGDHHAGQHRKADNRYHAFRAHHGGGPAGKYDHGQSANVTGMHISARTKGLAAGQPSDIRASVFQIDDYDTLSGKLLVPNRHLEPAQKLVENALSPNSKQATARRLCFWQCSHEEKVKHDLENLRYNAKYNHTREQMLSNYLYGHNEHDHDASDRPGAARPWGVSSLAAGSESSAAQRLVNSRILMDEKTKNPGIRFSAGVARGNFNVDFARAHFWISGHTASYINRCVQGPQIQVKFNGMNNMRLLRRAFLALERNAFEYSLSGMEKDCLVAHMVEKTLIVYWSYWRKATLLIKECREKLGVILFDPGVDGRMSPELLARIRKFRHNKFAGNVRGSFLLTTSDQNETGREVRLEIDTNQLGKSTASTTYGSELEKSTASGGVAGGAFGETTQNPLSAGENARNPKSILTKKSGTQKSIRIAGGGNQADVAGLTSSVSMKNIKEEAAKGTLVYEYVPTRHDHDNEQWTSALQLLKGGVVGDVSENATNLSPAEIAIIYACALERGEQLSELCHEKILQILAQADEKERLEGEKETLREGWGAESDPNAVSLPSSKGSFRRLDAGENVSMYGGAGASVYGGVGESARTSVNGQNLLGARTGSMRGRKVKRQKNHSRRYMGWYVKVARGIIPINEIPLLVDEFMYSFADDYHSRKQELVDQQELRDRQQEKKELRDKEQEVLRRETIQQDTFFGEERFPEMDEDPSPWGVPIPKDLEGLVRMGELLDAHADVKEVEPDAHEFNPIIPTRTPTRNSLRNKDTHIIHYVLQRRPVEARINVQPVGTLGDAGPPPEDPMRMRQSTSMTPVNVGGMGGPLIGLSTSAGLVPGSPRGMTDEPTEPQRIQTSIFRANQPRPPNLEMKRSMRATTMMTSHINRYSNSLGPPPPPNFAVTGHSDILRVGRNWSDRNAEGLKKRKNALDQWVRNAIEFLTAPVRRLLTVDRKVIWVWGERKMMLPPACSTHEVQKVMTGIHAAAYSAAREDGIANPGCLADALFVPENGSIVDIPGSGLFAASMDMGMPSISCRGMTASVAGLGDMRGMRSQMHGPIGASPMGGSPMAGGERAGKIGKFHDFYSTGGSGDSGVNDMALSRLNSMGISRVTSSALWSPIVSKRDKNSNTLGDDYSDDDKHDAEGLAGWLEEPDDKLRLCFDNTVKMLKTKLKTKLTEEEQEKEDRNVNHMSTMDAMQKYGVIGSDHRYTGSSELMTDHKSYQTTAERDAKWELDYGEVESRRNPKDRGDVKGKVKGKKEERENSKKEPREPPPALPGKRPPLVPQDYDYPRTMEELEEQDRLFTEALKDRMPGIDLITCYANEKAMQRNLLGKRGMKAKKQRPDGALMGPGKIRISSTQTLEAVPGHLMPISEGVVTNMISPRTVGNLASQRFSATLPKRSSEEHRKPHPVLRSPGAVKNAKNKYEIVIDENGKRIAQADVEKATANGNPSGTPGISGPISDAPGSVPSTGLTFIVNVMEGKNRTHTTEYLLEGIPITGMRFNVRTNDRRLQKDLYELQADLLRIKSQGPTWGEKPQESQLHLAPTPIPDDLIETFLQGAALPKTGTPIPKVSADGGAGGPQEGVSQTGSPMEPGSSMGFSRVNTSEAIGGMVNKSTGMSQNLQSYPGISKPRPRSPQSGGMKKKVPTQFEFAVAHRLRGTGRG